VTGQTHHQDALTLAPRKIAVIGGTGPQGRGLALRLGVAGHTVVIGSRQQDRAAEAAAIVATRAGRGEFTGALNRSAAETCELVLIVTPYAGHAAAVTELADALAGKVVISCVNALGFDKRGAYGLDVPAGSAAEELAAIVPSARVVGAFHHLAADSLWSGSPDLAHEDVLVCGDDREARDEVIALVPDVTGGRGVDAGPLRAARQLEPLTAVLINVNRRYGVRSGVRIVGLDPA
jgi:NADPH-dependent F420 reductase